MVACEAIVHKVNIVHVQHIIVVRVTSSKIWKYANTAFLSFWDSLWYSIDLYGYELLKLYDVVGLTDNHYGGKAKPRVQDVQVNPVAVRGSLGCLKMVGLVLWANRIQCIWASGPAYDKMILDPTFEYA